MGDSIVVPTPCNKCKGRIFTDTESPEFTAIQYFEIYNYYRQKWWYMGVGGQTMSGSPGSCERCKDSGRYLCKEQGKLVVCPCNVGTALDVLRLALAKQDSEERRRRLGAPSSSMLPWPLPSSRDRRHAEPLINGVAKV